MSNIYSISISLFVLFFATVTTESINGQTFNYPNIPMDSVSIIDDEGEQLMFRTIYGATQDDNMFSRIFNTGPLTYNGLLDPEKRQEYYVNVIRRMVIQERFIDFDLLENGHQVQLPTEDEIEEIKTKFSSYLEGGIAVTDFVNSVLLAGDKVPGYLERMTYIDNVPISNFEHFTAAVSGLSILFNGIQIWNTADQMFATRSLMLGLEVDLANQRLTYLQNNLNVNDSIISNAIAIVRNEINIIDDSFWNSWYRVPIYKTEMK